MKQAINLIIISFSCFSVFAQINLKGVIKTEKSNVELSFVNIGVIDKGMGTVTDEGGNFYLSLQEKHLQDSIKISMIGFKSRTYSVSDFKNALKESKEIFLVEQLETLDEIIVTNRKLKIKILGNRSKSRKNLYEASADLLGSEIGIKIKIKHSPTRLKKFNTRVLTRKQASFKFRLNFYDIKDGLPNNNLLRESVIIDEKDINDGLIEVDLEPYNIYVEDDFFVTLEWIQGDGRRKLQFPVSLLGPVIVERNTSQAKWNKHSIASIGFNVTVEY